MYWSSSWARILNVQDIWEEPRRQVRIYLQRVFYPPPSPVVAKIYSILAYDVPRKEDIRLTHQIPVQCRASVETHCCFNVGQSTTKMDQH